MVAIGVCSVIESRSHSDRSISAPLAEVISPRSSTFFHPNHSFRIRVTSALAPSSFPLTNTWWSPPCGPAPPGHPASPPSPRDPAKRSSPPASDRLLPSPAPRPAYQLLPKSSRSARRLPGWLRDRRGFGNLLRHVAQPVADLAVLAEVEPLALGLRAHPQSDRDVGDLEEHERHHEREADGDEGEDRLPADLG